MTGVEILAMEEVVTAYAFNWLVYVLFVLGFIVIWSLFGMAIGSAYNLLSYGLKTGLIVGIIIGLLFGIAPACTTQPKEYETRYKVTITDEVQMNDFLSKYEIIDQEGRIYTVREIEDGE